MAELGLALASAQKRQRELIKEVATAVIEGFEIIHNKMIDS